jgi:endonuclease/exonuclease/phosphatase family metal-dependent hydrolase
MQCRLVLAFALVALVHLDQSAAQVLRIGSWNVANEPNSSDRITDFELVLSAIGSESVLGNSARLGILALQETDTQSAQAVRDSFNNMYVDSTYDLIVSGADGGGDRTGFVYDSSLVSLVSQTELSGSLTHTILRATFDPIGLSVADPLTIYSIHLKSGSSLSDQNVRGIESEFIRDDADLFELGTSILFTGDFNMLGSSEPAWNQLTGSGNAQAFDLADAPGQWRDNPDFLSLHTQDPGGSMDDRFDLQFGTSSFFDSQGIDFVDGSFTVFGNNGTHDLNQPITTGTGASSPLLSALSRTSDHLPVFSDFVSAIPEPGHSILVVVSGLAWITQRRRFAKSS